MLTIENTTPWNTKELTAFLSFLCETTPIQTVKVSTLRARPGVKREDQRLYNISGVNFYGLQKGNPFPSSVEVEIISPKRAAARTDLLDRMAQSDDLEAHESALPHKVIGGVAHVFGKIKNFCSQQRAGRQKLSGDIWSYRKHYEGACDCSAHLSAYPMIRGNTQTRTAPPVDIAKLKQRGRWALESAERHRIKMEASLVQAAKLGERIRKEEAKRWRAKGDNR